MIKIILSCIPSFVCAFWCITLWTDCKETNHAKKFLGLFMFLNSLLYFTHFCFFNSLDNIFIIMDGFYTFISLAGYPMYYLYIRLLTKDIKLNRRYLWVLLPAALMGAFVGISYLLMSTEEAHAVVREILHQGEGNFAFSTIGNLQKIRVKIFVVIYVTQLPFVLYNSVGLITEYNRQVSNFFSNVENKLLLSTKNVLYILSVYALFSMLASIIGRAFFEKQPFLIMLPAFLFSILMYIVGLVGSRQNFTIKHFQQAFDKIKVNEKQLPEKEEDIPSFGELKEALIDLLETKKIFRRPELRLSDVASMLHTNRTYLSRMINTDMQLSFSDLINQHRVEHAKTLLTNKKKAYHSLCEIGELSGFSSESSFYRAFKKNTGYSPGDWEKVGNNF